MEPGGTQGPATGVAQVCQGLPRDGTQNQPPWGGHLGADDLGLLHLRCSRAETCPQIQRRKSRNLLRHAIS